MDDKKVQQQQEEKEKQINKIIIIINSCLFCRIDEDKDEWYGGHISQLTHFWI